MHDSLSPRYATRQQLLHWLTAVLMFSILAVAMPLSGYLWSTGHGHDVAPLKDGILSRMLPAQTLETRS